VRPEGAGINQTRFDDFERQEWQWFKPDAGDPNYIFAGNLLRLKLTRPNPSPLSIHYPGQRLNRDAFASSSIPEQGIYLSDRERQQRETDFASDVGILKETFPGGKETFPGGRPAKSGKHHKWDNCFISVRPD
jgi:hypothetical protein